MKILFIGDIYGRTGVEYLIEKINFLKEKYQSNIIIANAENVDNGKGLDYNNYKDLIMSGVDIMTMGNHTFHNKSIKNFILSSNIIRPVNLLDDKKNIGNGYKIIKHKNKRILIMNALGQVFINKDNLECPFKTIDHVLNICHQKYDYSFLDFHAQATSEKIALAHYFDGRIDAIVGTHTHVQTNDDKILPKKTLYITDVGMIGPYEEVIGKDKDIIINNFINKKNRKKHQIAKGKRQLNGILLTLGKHKQIKKINFNE
ncbi:TIGR00282 family metallophosphoesterase [Columbia Basin potato purple top phytoplasma]|uniref:TIGR00282 family metallophosphoesterase n=1 Tax=Columbia Basin potato purple top phytoplasma TaxID=307134 RepID=A0ABT5L9K0_9MOLU|nr:TIGR00282 family metallophosphoesterase [Columbia Basin potato purple top phytoplasma]MDC9031924.1 TIGR00282 family metallophosphoesterase [Columbia Basin potato purple top phytoplasma]